MSNIVIFDTEYTSREWSMEQNRWKTRQHKEIVQIAAIKCNLNSMKILETFNIYIKPTINPILSKYFTNLTGITNTKIDKEWTNFKFAYKQFEIFTKNNKCCSFWRTLDKNNLADWTIINENKKLLNIKTKKEINYINIAPRFEKRFKEQNILPKKINSWKIAKYLDININEIYWNEHNALFDTYSLREWIKYFKAKKLKDFIK